MRKKILILCFGLLVSGLWAQSDLEKGAKIVINSQAIQQTVNNTIYTVQVGVPYLGGFEGNTRTTNPADIRFPWDILYLYGTFAEDSFDISKGYFGDKVLLQWEIRNNLNLIDVIEISRRELGSTAPFQFVGSVSKDITQYEDKYVDGGVLYEYEVFAKGVSQTKEIYANFITGIGFRNPTAIVTGNVSFKGGNPVKNVTIIAESDGSVDSYGSCLRIPTSNELRIEGITKPIETASTLQAWVRPSTAYTDDNGPAIKLFILTEINNNAIEISANLKAASNILEVNIGGSLFEIENVYPSGKIDARGDDVMVPVTTFNTDFVHITTQIENGKAPLLFINGRPMTSDYRDAVHAARSVIDESDTSAYLEITVPTQTNNLALGSGNWDGVLIGGGKSASFDEIRIWKSIEDATDIRTDYRRYISGNDPDLISYLSANENTGNYAYDASREGFNYNKNDGDLRIANLSDDITWLVGSGNIPTSSQLGILGVTDANGNYEINSIPYSGTGESFTITPSFGQHKFEPNQQLVFLGQGSEVVNQINFTDTSSFIFKGKILYDTRGVFPSYAEADQDTGNGNTIAGGAAIIDENYNQYEINGSFYDKAQYWLNDLTTPADTSDDRLDLYATIPLAGANIYIDGQIVLDENNSPVESADDGTFDISVPIGNHFIRVEKNGHDFTYEGRFPADTGTFKEFFEDSQETVVFIDETRVTAVGRVVGGSVEAQKPIGFGENGLFEEDYVDGMGLNQKFTVSSKNNIGIANITLDYAPIGASVTKYTEFNFQTHPETGEYRIEALPLNYEIQGGGVGLKITSNSSIESNIIASGVTETVSFSNIPDATIPVFALPNSMTEQEGTPYHHEKSFIYRSTPVLKVIEQTSDEVIDVNATPLDDSDDIDISAGLSLASNSSVSYPVYTQFKDYRIVLNTFERYENKDSGSVEDIVPIVDGELKVTNNLAYPGTEVVATDPTDDSKIIYEFKAGLPSISMPFVKTLDIKYRINGNDNPAEDYNTEGIVLGILPDGGQTFITAGPDIPDIILRDPPGSNSSASITAGESISFTNKQGISVAGGLSQDVTISAGPSFGVGVGIFTFTEVVFDIEVGIQVSSTTSASQGTTKTYSFSQTISTSDSPSFVGADGDLYIGQSKNYFYGVNADVRASSATIGSGNHLELSNGTTSIFISKQRKTTFSEDPSNTFYVYSQKHILTTLIPELEALKAEIVAGNITPDPEKGISVPFYTQQINLWRKVILENENSKYRALKDRENLKSEVFAIVSNFSDEVQTAIDAQPDGEELETLESNFSAANNLATLVDSKFSDNVSFDSGAGQVTRSVSTSIVRSSTFDFNLEISESFAVTVGGKNSGIGVSSTTSGFASQAIDINLSEEQTSTLNISYTLKDNDPNNVLSVDVVNMFDGNGPVFATVGGRTSCPYEGAEKSNFYNSAVYTAHKNNPAYVVAPLPTAERIDLSFATQKIEVPAISVTIADISNIPESNNAEFELIFENNTITETDAYFQLIVDNTTNPNNALINIGQNGTVVFVPYGQKTPYTLTLGKSVSDVYDYENIKVVLQSRCDSNISANVLISAHFVPSCSEVAVKAPLNNWVYNTGTAFNNNGSTNPLSINLSEYNQAFNSFKKLDLEYRLASAPNWTRLHTYYNMQAFYDEAIINSESEISLIETPELIFAFNIAGLQLQDGDYEIRARSTCVNGTNYTSEVITGSVDIHAPQQFGTPLPTDGILGAGEDLRVSFNENIFYNSAVSTIEIKGETNQLPIDHSVSLRFEGPNNTATIESPRLVSGDLSLEFWMNNATTAATATVMNQQNGLNIRLENGDIYATLGDVTANGTIATDGLFHHYTITHNNALGSVTIYEDDKDIGGGTGTANTQFTNNNPLVIGGNTFIGNMHDVRLWTKSISLSTAVANFYTKFLGNEANLIGLWPMKEGRGNIAKDLARFNHATVSADWDIKPKGNSYEFANGQYLELDNVGFVQLTNTMDATISFWIKTASAQEATIFSNGRGKGGGTPATSDPVQSNGFANKWAINMNSSGGLSFASEETEYVLTAGTVADNKWHHITLLFNRNGSLRTYVDAQQVSSNPITDIGGFSGNQAWLGARGFKDQSNIETVDRPFTGKIDEFRLWNTLRNVDQISRDRFNEMDVESIGLLLYARMNAPDPATANGPRYYHAFSNQSVIPSNAVLSSGSVNYSNDIPAIKPERKLIKFQVNHVINGDDMILEPVISDWAALEGQILDITVHRMFDASNNMQESPITWTAFVQKNEMSWFVEGYNDVVDIVKNGSESPSFEITIINKGGLVQPYNIAGIPNWLSLSSTSGSLAPDSKVTITATIDEGLSAGEYIENLYLQTDFGLDEKIQLEVRVLAEEPEWIIDPNSFDYSMNIVGRISIDGVFSDDIYDKVAAFSGGELRGVADIIYNESYQEYFVFLTVYSNTVSSDLINFNIWDASKGQIVQATINTDVSVTFIENNVLGSLSSPSLFENTNIIEQEIDFNQGWTWVSFNVNDANFSNLNALTAGMSLETSDRILSHSPSLLEIYTKDNATPANSSWSGAISASPGLSTNFMYKVKLTHQQQLKVSGAKADVSTWMFPIKQNWNWLPYPLSKNVSVNEALSTFDAVDGDIVKSQNLFAIYDPLSGWSGTLSYLETGKGYMVKSSKDQDFKYANIFGKSSNGKNSGGISGNQTRTTPEFAKYPDNMNAVVLLPDGYNELFVYDVDGVLKGKAVNQSVGDKKLSFITIYGEDPKELTFHIGNGITQKATQKGFTFKGNNVLGTVANPVILEEAVLEDLKLYPNPFNNELVIKLMSNKTQKLELTLFNVIGQLVYSKKSEIDKGQNVIRINPTISNGVYFLKINLNDVITTHKVIKS